MSTTTDTQPLPAEPVTASDSLELTAAHDGNVEIPEPVDRFLRAAIATPDSESLRDPCAQPFPNPGGVFFNG